MKQIIIFINQMLTCADVAIQHRFMSPGSNANEPVLAVVRVQAHPIIRK